MNTRRLALIATILLTASCGAGSVFKSQDTFDNGTPAAPRDQYQGASDATKAVPTQGTPSAGDATNAAISQDQMSRTGEQQASDEASTTEPAVGDQTPAASDDPGKADTTPSTTPPKDPNVVEFHIKAGTGNSPWNDANTVINAKVGQTIRFYNDDQIKHRLHTGGAPCPHGPDFNPGTTFDCVITKAIDSATNPGATYDHNVGPSALVLLNVVK